MEDGTERWIDGLEKRRKREEWGERGAGNRYKQRETDTNEVTRKTKS